SPQIVWQWSPPGEVVQRVALDTQFAYTGYLQELQVLQLNGSAAPTLIDDFTLPSDLMDIAAADGFVYVGTQLSGVRILDNSMPGAMVEVASISVGPTYANGVAVDGDRLYIAADELTGLLVYDISNPA